jgi:hypothetical protein
MKAERIFNLQFDTRDHVEVLAPTGWQNHGVVGLALRKRVGQDKELFEYWAQANEHGWRVAVTSPRGYTEDFQGATFNLGLEVAAAIRRTI